MAINPNTLEWGYRTFIDGNSSDQKASYSFNFNSGGEEFTFIPKSVIEKGVDTGDKNYVFPAFLNQDTLTKLGQTGQYVDLNGVSWYGDYLKNNVGASTEGFLVPAGSFDFGISKIVPNNVRGVGTTKEGLSYIMETPEGKVGQYLASDGKVTTLTKTKGSSLLGNVFGDWVDDFTTSTGIAGAAGEVNDFFQTDLGKAIKVAALVASLGGSSFAEAGTEAGASAGAEAGAPELLGEAGGNTFALEAGSEGVIPLGDAAAGGVVVAPSNQVYDYGDPTAGNVTSEIIAPPAAELTAQEVTDMIAKEQAGAMSAQEIQAMIDAEAATAASVAGATPAQVAAANAAGMSVLDYIKAGFLVNAITGDPLKLAGDQPSGGGGGFAGFEQVPIPADWRSPTYAASSAPIDLSSIFTDQNLLAGTQWQGLPQQQNVSFNDIFASGQQQTPMGNMVDINQIVSAILGQNTASQKPA
jgi:hypothetical protein